MVYRSILWAGLVLAVLVILPATVRAESAPAPYELTFSAERVSLRAVDAVVADVMRDLGRRAGFEVIADGAAAQLVTVDFADLPVRQAVARICKATGYVEVVDPVRGGVARIVLTASRTKVANRATARRDPLPARPAPPIEPIEPAPAPAVPDPPEQKPPTEEPAEDPPGTP